MDDQDAAKFEKQRRYWGFLVAAVYVLGVGGAYLIAGAILSGIIQVTVLVLTLLIGGGFLAMWWYSSSIDSDSDDHR